MIEPSKIRDISKKYSDQNLGFRAFLKNQANGDELDAHFIKLHNELFSVYDCCKCNNCCRAYDIVLDIDEIKAISKFLGLTEQNFIDKYLIRSEEGYEIKEKALLLFRVGWKMPSTGMQAVPL